MHGNCWDLVLYTAFFILPLSIFDLEESLFPGWQLYSVLQIALRALTLFFLEEDHEFLYYFFSYTYTQFIFCNLVFLLSLRQWVPLSVLLLFYYSTIAIKN